MEDEKNAKAKLGVEVADDGGKIVELWPERADTLTEFVDRLGPADISLEEMIGGQVLKRTESLSLPLIATYVDSVRQTTYRKAEGMSLFSAKRVPGDSVWVEVDPRMSLRKALSLYGDRLLAFEKVHRETTLEILVLPFRKKSEMTLRILVKAQSSVPG